jgi:hypothetical protein
MQSPAEVCAKYPTTEQILPAFPPCVLVKDAKMKTCQTCKRQMLSDGLICGACKPPAVKPNLPGDRTGENGRREMPMLDSYENEASLSKSVDISAFTSGWAAGLMMGQLEYCNRMTYRKPKTRVLDISNGRSYRPHHCGTCEKTRSGNV